ncbi:MAG TPA: sensor histidine kinase [Streptosporangiaceae bacterium]
MRSLTAYGQRLADRARRLPPLAVDAVITAACWLFVVVQAVADDRLKWWVFVLGTANVLPLLWRRRYPLTVTFVTGAFTTWLSLLGAVDNLAAAQLVATYTFAALCPPLERLIAITGTVIGVTVSILIPNDGVLSLGVVGITFAVAYALGTGARARRDRIAMLEERARRLAGEQEAAATRERERIAREMHDILAHSMSMVVIQAEAGPVAVRTDPDKAEEVFDTISATAREALAQLRRALGVLRAGEAERHPQPGLDSLPSLVDDVRRTGLAVTLEEDGEPRPVPPDLAATAYRIVQESLTNAVKHAAASSVRVRLRWRDAELHIEVRDDGRGAADGGVPSSGGSAEDGGGPGRGREPGGGVPGEGRESGGHGLAGMRERVAAAGGELIHGPGRDGVGYRVAASLPLTSASLRPSLPPEP